MSYYYKKFITSTFIASSLNEEANIDLHRKYVFCEISKVIKNKDGTRDAVELFLDETKQQCH